MKLVPRNFSSLWFYFIIYLVTCIRFQILTTVNNNNTVKSKT
jgi:hypothetical protein